MIEDDLKHLCQVVAQALRTVPGSRRDVERTLKVGSGRLGEIAAGDDDLKVDSLTGLARLLRIPPGDLLAAGCPETVAAAQYRLSDWLGTSETPSPPLPALPTAEELTAMIRAAVRDELAARRKP